VSEVLPFGFVRKRSQSHSHSVKASDASSGTAGGTSVVAGIFITNTLAKCINSNLSVTSSINCLIPSKMYFFVIDSASAIADIALSKSSQGSGQVSMPQPSPRPKLAMEKSRFASKGADTNTRLAGTSVARGKAKTEAEAEAEGVTVRNTQSRNQPVPVADVIKRSALSSISESTVPAEKRRPLEYSPEDLQMSLEQLVQVWCGMILLFIVCFSFIFCRV